MFINANFTGLWHREHSSLRDNILSRTGYVITFCGCPNHWASKLQSLIALRTTESEYIALSMATRELLPLQHLLEEISETGPMKIPMPETFFTTHTPHFTVSKIYEDNAACIILAYSDASKPCTKHIAIKWHHFKDQLKAGHITLIKIPSDFNWVDIFIKPLTQHKFEFLHRLMMGW